jgi:hypothetical protein
MTTQNTAQTVVFLEELARIVEKSPATYSTAAAADLAENIRAMADAVTTEAHVDPALLDNTRKYAALDWQGEIAAVLIAKEHRANVL